MYQIIGFYLSNLIKLISVWTSWTLVPGVNFFIFIICCFIISVFLKYFWKEREEDYILSRRDRAWFRRSAREQQGKHTYKPKHAKGSDK